MLYLARVLPILEVWPIVRRSGFCGDHHVEWWVVAAWASLALVVVAGLAAATRTGELSAAAPDPSPDGSASDHP